MIISDKLKKEFLELQESIDLVTNKNTILDTQLEGFLKSFEKARYNLLADIKLYNNNKEYEYEKIKTIDDEYKAEFSNNILKIYIPETMPSYKNLKTHAHKRILLNVAEVTKQYVNLFTDNEVFIYVKVFDKILGWDIDNKYIKPIADALIASNVIKDDNLTKMFYSAKGEFSEIPHTEIYVFDSKKITQFLEKTIT
jgi:Holliday junction resolvase RusA-like endonuclease